MLSFQLVGWTLESAAERYENSRNAIYTAKLDDSELSRVVAAVDDVEGESFVT